MALDIAGHLGHGDCRPPTRPGPSLHPITVPKHNSPCSIIWKRRCSCRPFYLGGPTYMTSALPYNVWVSRSGICKELPISPLVTMTKKAPESTRLPTPPGSAPWHRPGAMTAMMEFFGIGFNFWLIQFEAGFVWITFSIAKGEDFADNVFPLLRTLRESMFDFLNTFEGQHREFSTKNIAHFWGVSGTKQSLDMSESARYSTEVSAELELELFVEFDWVFFSAYRSETLLRLERSRRNPSAR